MSKINILKPIGTNVPYDTSDSTNYIVNQNGGGLVKLWIGSLLEYGDLTSLDPDTVYIIEQNAT